MSRRVDSYYLLDKAIPEIVTVMDVTLLYFFASFSRSFVCLLPRFLVPRAIDSDDADDTGLLNSTSTRAWTTYGSDNFNAMRNLDGWCKLEHGTDLPSDVSTTLRLRVDVSRQFYLEL